MIPRNEALSLVAGAALATGAVFAATGAASPSRGPNLTNVPAANTKSDGFSPASALSPELSQVVVAQGSTKLENTSPLTSYYGYDNDVLQHGDNPTYEVFVAPKHKHGGN